MTGLLLAGVFATASIEGSSGLIEGNPQLLLIERYGSAVALAWSAGVTSVLLKLAQRLRVEARFLVSLQQETKGLDISQHGDALQ